MLLIYAPLAKSCEPPAGIAQLAGTLRGHNLKCTLLDANHEALLYLLENPAAPSDTWSRRAVKNISSNLDAIRLTATYQSLSRYKRAVADINRTLDMTGKLENLSLSLVNYQDKGLSPLKSGDLRHAAENYEANIFFPYFEKRLEELICQESPPLIGFSLNYLSQALTTFAMIGFLKQRCPEIPIVVGGGLITSWRSNPAWENRFGGLIDHLIDGPGELPLLRLLKEKSARLTPDSRSRNSHHLEASDSPDKSGIHKQKQPHFSPDFRGLPLRSYLSPGLILPYAASSGCYWNKCLFCPEKAEENPYTKLSEGTVLSDISLLEKSKQPVLLHLLDNAVSPSLMKRLIQNPPGIPWYGFARISPLLTEPDFCRALKKSGCVMIKLGLESGDQDVLDSMHKGIDLTMAAKTLNALKQAGIATYVYLLFGTPAETPVRARKTLDFTALHHEAITFLNLAVFNMPVCSVETKEIAVKSFYDGDLSLYTDFVHPQGWNRKSVRQFLAQEFKKHPAVAEIIKRDPPLFTSNHAPFFGSDLSF